MQLLDGKRVAEAIKNEVRDEISALAGGRKPTLALVRVGEDPASASYVQGKAKACEECGIGSQNVQLPGNAAENTVLDVLREFSRNPEINGILLQLPVPPQVDQDRAVASIDPIKDVDGFHPENLGLLASGKPRFVPCTPLGIRELLVRYGVETRGKRAVVIGRSVIVGKPMALLLCLKGPGGDATVTICHSRTRDIGAITREADIVIAAMGKPRFLTAEMVKEGVVVVDVGINRVQDANAKKGYRIVGDVDFDAVAPKTSFITPVPGGVGKMTVAMLMWNTLRALKLQETAAGAIR
jgi:methylenetetrahydrofolate dehydrogenase (NADP+)/methenyltetrahydrofolate cyclohydrolase